MDRLERFRGKVLLRNSEICKAFTVYGAYKADSPLVESGLVGPVRLLRQQRMKQ
jgi:hypothetical protein